MLFPPHPPHTQVQISFPDASQQSDVVQLRGQKPDVDQCYKYMQTLVAELVGGWCGCGWFGCGWCGCRGSGVSGWCVCGFGGFFSVGG